LAVEGRLLVKVLQQRGSFRDSLKARQEKGWGSVLRGILWELESKAMRQVRGLVVVSAQP
jgi:hypothetical protein